MSDEDARNLKSLVDHVGIGQSGRSHETLMELMSLTLHCLGGVRLLVAQAEKEKAAIAAAEESYELKDLIDPDEAMREVFSSAVNRMLHSISVAGPLDDLDPSRHLVESFPLDHRIGSSHWLPIQWALLGDELFISSNNESVNESMIVSESPSPSPSPVTDLSVSDVEEADCRHRVTLINAIAKSHPEVMEHLDREGRSILHYASRLSSVALLECVMKYCGSGFGPTQPNHNGAFPLHNAARFSKSLPVMEYVLDVCPAIVSRGNNDGTLPLHWAAAKNTNLDIINRLILQYPEAMSAANHEGYLPLHSAGQNLQLHIVKAILAADPTAISILDFEGGVPLHHACCFNTNIEVVQYMDALYQAGATLAQKDGITPLHLAASQNSSPVVMKFLLQKYRQAAFAVDDDGWLPLHCLVTRHRDDMTASRIECLLLLLKVNPSAVSAVRNDGQTPFQLAKARGHRDKILRLMLFAQPDHDRVEFARLNWFSYRRLAVISCLYVNGSPEIPSPIDLELSDPTINNNMEGCLSRKCLHIIRKLTDGYLGRSGLSIKNHILIYIIKFL